MLDEGNFDVVFIQLLRIFKRDIVTGATFRPIFSQQGHGSSYGKSTDAGIGIGLKLIWERKRKRAGAMFIWLPSSEYHAHLVNVW